jgi:hypothetical protein
VPAPVGHETAEPAQLAEMHLCAPPPRRPAGPTRLAASDFVTRCRQGSDRE